MEVPMKRRFPVISVLLISVLLPLLARGQTGKKPLTYAGKVKTPLLMTQNEKDERVPVEQAVEFCRAVQLTGTPVELHIYPGESHGTMMPNHQLDKLRKTESWFKKYLH